MPHLLSAFSKSLHFGEFIVVIECSVEQQQIDLVERAQQVIGYRRHGRKISQAYSGIGGEDPSHACLFGIQPRSPGVRGISPGQWEWPASNTGYRALRCPQRDTFVGADWAPANLIGYAIQH